MKKLTITLVAVALMVAPAALEAQANTNANNTIAVNATVGKVFRWSAGQSLEFGTVAPLGDGVGAAVTVPTHQPTADADGRRSGYVTLYYNAATTVTVEAPTALDGTNGGTLAVTFTCGAATEGNATLNVLGSAACADADELTLGLGGNNSRKVNIFFGGTLSAAAIEGAEADMYSGTITLLAAQN